MVSDTPSANDSNGTTRVEHDYDASTPPSIAIVRAIAVIEDVDPVEEADELGLRLSNHVDPAALDQLVVDESDVDVSIELERKDDRYAIWVRDCGRIVVCKFE